MREIRLNDFTAADFMSDDFEATKAFIDEMAVKEFEEAAEKYKTMKPEMIISELELNVKKELGEYSEEPREKEDAPEVIDDESYNEGFFGGINYATTNNVFLLNKKDQSSKVYDGWNHISENERFKNYITKYIGGESRMNNLGPYSENTIVNELYNIRKGAPLLETDHFIMIDFNSYGRAGDEIETVYIKPGKKRGFKNLSKEKGRINKSELKYLNKGAPGAVKREKKAG